MDRRNFLKSSLSGIGSLSMLGAMSQFYSTPLFAQSRSGYKALVCVILDGGVDCNNVIVPADSRYDGYFNARWDIAVPKDQLQLLKNTSDKQSYGLHPALAQTATLFNAGRAAAIANVGSLTRPVSKKDLNFTNELPVNLFSHIGQVGAWESAIASTSSSSGWAGRVSDALVSSSGSGKMPAVVSASGHRLIGQGVTTDQVTASDGDNSLNLTNTISRLQSYFNAAEDGARFNAIQSYVSDQQRQTMASYKVVNDTFQAGSGLKTAFRRALSASSSSSSRS